MIFLYLVWFSLCSPLLGIVRQWSREKLDCERSLFFIRFSEGSAREGVEQLSRETRETRATAREASPFSRLQPCAWSFSCLATFARRTEKKEKLVVVFEETCHFVA